MELTQIYSVPFVLGKSTAMPHTNRKNLLRVRLFEGQRKRLLEIRLQLVQFCVEHVWKISGRSPSKNEGLLSITSETTFGLLLPNKLFFVF